MSRSHFESLFLFACALISQPAFARSPFVIDPSFGDGGIFVLDIDDTNNVDYTPQGLAIASDGKLLLAAQSGLSAAPAYIAVRLTEDGVLDPTFGTQGLARANVGGGPRVQSVALTATGAIVLAGGYQFSLADGGTLNSFAVARFLANGALDTAFGSAGILRPRFGTAFQIFNGQAQLPDGRMRFGGQGASSRGGVANLVYGTLGNGDIDPSFGDGGVVEVDYAPGAGVPYDYGGTVVLDAQQRILVPSISNTYGDFGLARLLPNGVLDSNFTDNRGLPGRVLTDFFGGDDACFVVLQLSDQNLLCAGRADTDAGSAFALARYHPTGERDQAFGVSGRVALNFGERSEVRGLAQLPDGTVIAVGSASNATGDNDMVVAFLNSAGGLDSFYGDGGVMRFDVSPGRDDGAHTVALDRQGRLVVYGETTTPLSNALTVIRLTTSAGAVDAGSDGGSDAGDAGSDGGADAGDARGDGGPDAVDAGNDGGPGAGRDGGGEPATNRVLSVGCACSSTESAAVALAWLALVALAARRRRG